ncbi:vitellin-degrading protease-like [Manduca sexta]|uniref:vitellin-degrading protease-like n=1 Tax=Manduca sexta TaxID=7130 RepID=UPI00188EB888|nr:vitellin-degrading protease-like [Manduca sexta]
MISLVFNLALLSTVACIYIVRHREDVSIVGGIDIDIKEAPHQISLQLYGSHACGGSILDNDIIITAAHCLLLSNNTEDFTIRAGSSSHDEGGESTRSKQIHHPLTYSDVVKPIDMANAGEDIPDEEECSVTGWGLLKVFFPIISGGVCIPKHLQGVVILKVNDDKCYEAYKQLNPVTERMVCAGVPQGGKSACNGDSGGPLVYNNKLHGIVSWGYGCAKPGYPTVFSKVSALRNWIDENIAKLK